MPRIIALTQIGIRMEHEKIFPEKTVPLSCRVPISLQEQLLAAMAATGASKTDLVTDCIKIALKAVVNQILSKQKSAQERWGELTPGDDRQPRRIVKQQRMPEIEEAARARAREMQLNEAPESKRHIHGRKAN